MSKKPEQSTGKPVANSDDAPGEFPVHGHEPLSVPKGFSIAALLERVAALEDDVKALKAKR